MDADSASTTANGSRMVLDEAQAHLGGKDPDALDGGSVTRGQGPQDWIAEQLFQRGFSEPPAVFRSVGILHFEPLCLDEGV